MDWTEVANRKAFFDKFAKNKNFDPHVPNNWYKVKLKDILAYKVGCLEQARVLPYGIRKNM